MTSTLFVEWFTLRDAFSKNTINYTHCQTVCQYVAENFVGILSGSTNAEC